MKASDKPDRDDDPDATAQAQPWLSVGWIAKGLLSVVIGALGLEIARRGRSRNDADPVGALTSLAEVSAGRALVFAVATGLAAYAVWQLWAAIAADPDEMLGAAKRIGWAGLAAVYGLLAEMAFVIALEGGPVDEGDDGPTSPVGLTDRLLDLTGGRWVIAAVGLGTAGVGAYNLWKALSREFLNDIATDDLAPAHRTALTAIGTAGFAARALLLGVVGWLFVEAARQQRANRAAGVDGALDTLSRATGGTVLLVATGVGLIAAGVYDIVTFRRQNLA